MKSRSFRRHGQHLLILPDRFIEQPLALVRFAGSLMQPHGVRRDAREPDHLQIRVVPEQSSGVVEHFRIVWIAPAQLESDGHGAAVASEIRVGPLQVKADHATEGSVG